MIYLPKQVPVEAFKLEHRDAYVVVRGDEARVVSREEFEDAFRPAEIVRVSPELVVGQVAAFNLYDGAAEQWSEAPDAERYRIARAYGIDHDPEIKAARYATTVSGRPLPGNAGEPGRPLPGVPLTPEDLRPAAEKLAEALAARTTDTPVGQRGQVDVDAVIADVRTQVDQEIREKPEAAPDVRIQDTDRRRRKRNGPGRGSKLCPECGRPNAARSRTCLCGFAFINSLRKKRR